jgi:hypothetical protein
MPVTGARGFSLVDLLISVVLLGLLATLSVRMLLGLGRILRAGQERAGIETGLDVALGYLGSELVDAGPGDLQQVAPDSLGYRAPRLTGFTCRITPTEIQVGSDRLFQLRLPQAGRDSVLLYLGRRSARGLPSDWLALPLLGVSPSSCAGRPALTLMTTIDSAVLGRAILPAMAPVRTFEVMQVRLYRSLGSWWFGARSISAGEGIQPLAGPFDTTGGRFEFRDSAGALTNQPQTVRGIRASLGGQAIGWTSPSVPQAVSGSLRLAPANLRP